MFSDVPSLFYELLISQDANLLVRAFITYVRQLLENNTVVWSPHTARDIDAIECVQRRFTNTWLPAYFSVDPQPYLRARLQNYVRIP